MLEIKALKALAFQWRRRWGHAWGVRGSGGLRVELARPRQPKIGSETRLLRTKHLTLSLANVCSPQLCLIPFKSSQKETSWRGRAERQGARSWVSGRSTVATMHLFNIHSPFIGWTHLVVCPLLNAYWLQTTQDFPNYLGKLHASHNCVLLSFPQTCPCPFQASVLLRVIFCAVVTVNLLQKTWAS